MFEKLVFPENRAVYETIRKNVVHPDRPQMAIRRKQLACWTSKATERHQNMKYLLLFHGNNYYPNAPQRYVSTYTAVLFNFKTIYPSCV